AVMLDDAPADGEPETASRAGLGSTPERLEELLARGRVEALPIVAHDDLAEVGRRFLASRLDANLQSDVGTSVADRVLDQIGEDLARLIRVDQRGRQLADVNAGVGSFE